MDSMNLKDFRPGNPDLDPDDKSLKPSKSKISASMYHEEINTLKIDKLSNRVTIISIIIPCLISAIIVFAYIDMKEKVFDVDVTKQNQVTKIAEALEERLNALDLKMAKNTFDIENKLPELDKKDIAIEGQIAKIASSKVDVKTIEDQFTKFETRIANNANQDKSTIQTMERINKEMLSSIKKNQAQLDKTAKDITEDLTSFKKQFDARLLELEGYESQVGEIRKSTSLMDKRYKSLEQDSVKKALFDEKTLELETRFDDIIKNLNQEIEKLNKRLTANITRFEKNLERLSTPGSPVSKPKPQINIDSSEAVNIEEQPLTQ